mmetsp:Transcript_64606/g.199965  ORF Transcript_64606/g.199965 Transcript_64606/m.199965 type:complete len:487 (-) Transcript_64606:173-1633(-)
MTGGASVPEPIRKRGSDARRSSKGLVDGFRVMPEPESLRVTRENLAPFTMPVEAFTFTPPPGAVVCKFKNGDKERKIYCNVEVTETERDQLRQLQEEVRNRGMTFMPSIAVMASRFLSRARGDPHKAVKLMTATNEWRQEFFGKGPVTDADVIEDFKHGIVYFTGRDCALRPTIVVRAKRIPQQWYQEKRIDKLIRILIFCMEYMIRYMLVPGRIENNCLIVDLKGLTFNQVPISALSEIYKVMSHHYIGRVYRFYICNMPSALSLVAGMAKSLLTDRQKQKLVMVSEPKKLREEFALHQLERDLGGSRQPAEQFLPFPLQPGPFEPGCASGPDRKAVCGAHRALTRLGAIGKLWDPERSKEQNERVEFDASAAGLLERCGLSTSEEDAQTPTTAHASEEEVLRHESVVSESCSEASKDSLAAANVDASTEAGTCRVTVQTASFDSRVADWTVLEDDRASTGPMAGRAASLWGGFTSSCWCPSNYS